MHRTAICSCKTNGTHALDITAVHTSCSKYNGGVGTLPNRVCPAGHEMYGGLCYEKCPADSKRTAVSTCVHEVRFRANTHLWVAHHGIELLEKSDDPIAKKVAAILSASDCRTQWENGLWDADDTLGEGLNEHAGSHFYNGAGRDWEGRPTKVVTYTMDGMEPHKDGNARQNAKLHLAKIGGMTTNDQCRELGLAIHYLTDVTQPMHAASYSAMQMPMYLHPVYEEYVGAWQADFPVNAAWERRWLDKSPDDVFHETAVRANGRSPALMKVLVPGGGTVCTVNPHEPIIYTGFCFFGDAKVKEMTGELLRDAYQSTASYLYAALKSIAAKR
jgi:phospholipase C